MSTSLPDMRRTVYRIHRRLKRRGVSLVFNVLITINTPECHCHCAAHGASLQPKVRATAVLRLRGIFGTLFSPIEYALGLGLRVENDTLLSALNGGGSGTWFRPQRSSICSQFYHSTLRFSPPIWPVVRILRLFRIFRLFASQQYSHAYR